MGSADRSQGSGPTNNSLVFRSLSGSFARRLESPELRSTEYVWRRLCLGLDRGTDAWIMGLEYWHLHGVHGTALSARYGVLLTEKIETDRPFLF